jgi:hypothetical protein
LFRADDRKVDLLASCEGQDGLRVGNVTGNRSSQPRDAGISRRAEELADIAIGRETSDQRMLSGAAAEDQNSHD